MNEDSAQKQNEISWQEADCSISGNLRGLKKRPLAESPRLNLA